jgi:hypothetical protein
VAPPQYTAPAGTGQPPQLLPAPQLAPAQYQYQPSAPPVAPGTPTLPNGNPTFPYDGGPQSPLPLPPAENVGPTSGPQPTVPLKGKLVSLPLETTGGTTPLMSTQFIGLGVSPSSAANVSGAPAANGLSYPAYGEQSLPPVPRKQAR